MRSKHIATICLIVFLILVVPQMYAQGRTYLGAEKCGKLCHKVEFTSWSATKHAKAFESLKPEEQAKKECVNCHVTGGTKDLPGVQCEACHGPGSEYKTIAIMKVREKAIAAGLVIPTEKICVTCHNNKSPHYKGFNFAEASKKVHDKKPKPTKADWRLGWVIPAKLNCFLEVQGRAAAVVCRV